MKGRSASQSLSATNEVPEGSVLKSVLLFIQTIICQQETTVTLIFALAMLFCIILLIVHNQQLKICSVFKIHLLILKLVLHAGKTKLMFFFFFPTGTDFNSLCLPRRIVVTLIESPNINIFGIWRDESFTFKYHTENFRKTLPKTPFFCIEAGPISLWTAGKVFRDNLCISAASCCNHPRGKSSIHHQVYNWGAPQYSTLPLIQ